MNGFMDKIQKLELMDKIQRELKDLEQSQTAVLKKVSQIAAHNITLNVELLDQKLPDLQGTIDANVVAISEISEAFGEYRNKFFNDNKMGTQVDPTA
jgi:oligoribonuclease (3'-5' exoribonuclease)